MKILEITGTTDLKKGIRFTVKDLGEFKESASSYTQMSEENTRKMNKRISKDKMNFSIFNKEDGLNSKIEAYIFVFEEDKDAGIAILTKDIKETIESLNENVSVMVECINLFDKLKKVR